MERKTLFRHVAIWIIIITALKFIGDKLHLFTSISFYDIIMHFLGGVWLGIFFVWLFYKEIIKKENLNLVFTKTILLILLVGLAWEVFEVFNYQIILKNEFDVADTISDLIFDLLGGITSFLIYKRKFIKTKTNTQF
jgi:hypothetical protein